MKKLIIGGILVCLTAYIGGAQDIQTDSLKIILSKTTDLQEKYWLLDQINSEYYKVGTGESNVANGFEMIRIASELKNDSMIARAYNSLGDYYALTKGDYNAGLEYFFKGIPYALKEKNTYVLPSLYSDIAAGYWLLGNTDQQILFLLKAEAALPEKTHPGYDYLVMQIKVGQAFHYILTHQPDKALPLIKAAEQINSTLKYDAWTSFIQTAYGSSYLQKADTSRAKSSFLIALELDKKLQVPWFRFVFKTSYINFLIAKKEYGAAIEQNNQLLQVSRESSSDYFRLAAFGFLKQIYDLQHNTDSAYLYARQELALKDSVFNSQIYNRVQALNFGEEMRQKEESEQRKQKIKTVAVFIGFSVILLVALILYLNSRQRKKANVVLERTLTNLKQTQTQLIQSEKMASLGELTAGIAHEIQNPLNFVNNFSEVNTELIDELEQEVDKGNLDEVKALAKDIKENEQKINHHGKRADAIVKGMLQHSRSSSGVKEPTDINALCDEYLRLSYHGLRAKDKSFNATIKTDFDESIGNINIIPQDIGRVILNLLTNAFYAAPLPPEGGFKDPAYKHEPTVWLSTKKIGDRVLISVKDNGPGIPQKIIDKIFQPFFTTKPTGQGTGLGLSLSYDIVKAHGGELKVETKEGEGTTFIISLPVNTNE